MFGFNTRKIDNALIVGANVGENGEYKEKAFLIEKGKEEEVIPQITEYFEENADKLAEAIIAKSIRDSKRTLNIEEDGDE